MFAVHDLNAFVAVADTGSVRAGAQRIHRTQSAVSQALRRLEAVAGFTLMDRSEYRIRLTDEGLQFAKRARALLQQARDLRQFADVIAGGTEERVRIVVHGALPIRAWAPSITSVAKAYPDTVIDIVAGEVDSPVRALLDGDADLALLILPPSTPAFAALEHRHLGQIRFASVVRPELADSVADLPQIIVSDFNESSNSFGVVEGRRYCRVSNHATKAALILQGMGWGSVPLDLVEQPLAEGDLARIEPCSEFQQTHQDFYLYRSLSQPHGPVLRALWKVFAGATEPNLTELSCTAPPPQWNRAKLTC